MTIRNSVINGDVAVKNKFLALLGLVVLPVSANADLVTWTDWTAITGGGAVGSMGDIDIRVSALSGSINGPSQISCGTNWWTEPFSTDPDYNGPAYTQGSVDNAPTPCEQVALNSQVSLSVTFSSPVDTLYMALLSVGQPNYTVTYDFDTSFTVDSDGWGFWNNVTGAAGTYSLGSGDAIAMNEIHGVLAFNGPISTLSFTTNPNENWHAFTFGTVASVPEPGTLALFGLGLLGIGAARRRKV